jgi:protein-disulfide isomerase
MKSSGETKLLLGLALFVLLGGGFLVFSNVLMNRPPQPPITEGIKAKAFEPLVARGRHSKGDPAAPITIVEFADFECPSCRRAYKSVLSRLDDNQNVRLVFHHMPLSDIHPMALPAAVAAEAAARQNKFWPMYEALFDPKAPPLNEKYLEQAARKIGLDMARFRKDLFDPAVPAKIREDIEFARSQGVEVTPTFFVRDAEGKITRVIGSDSLAELLSKLKVNTASAP